MTLEDAKSLLNYPDAIWFRSGELSVIQDNSEPLSYSDLDNDVDLSILVEVDPQVILGPVAPKLYFYRDRTIEGRKPKKCYSFNLPQIPPSQRKDLVPTRMKCFVTKSNSESYVLSNAVEEASDINKDPETLDDSEIEELLQQTLPEGVEDHEPITKSAKVIDCMYLLVTETAIYRVGDVIPFFVYQGIDDCQVFSSKEIQSPGLIVVILATGELNAMIVNKTLEHTTMTYRLDLGFDGSWFIRKHQNDRQFVVFNKRESTCKFFEIRDRGKVRAVNNLTLYGSKILECTFFPSESDTHFFLFVATLQSKRLVYYCIEWDTNEPKMKKVHYLTYFTDHTFQACAALLDKKILVFYDGIIEVVSANQLMSGETNFSRADVQNLQTICDHFYAPNLLEVLKREKNQEFSRFAHCLVFGTLSGHISACLVDDDDHVVVYSMTRFKGLMSLCSVDERANLDNEYPLIVISYGRTIELFLDIRQMRPLGSANLVSSFSALTFKHTMDSASEGSSRIMTISPRKRAGQQTSNLWMTCPSSITNLETSNPLRKVYHICKLQDIPFFRAFRFYHLDDLEPGFKDRLSRDFGELSSQSYLIFGIGERTSGPSHSSVCFMFDLSTSKPQLTQVDDLMIETDEECFDIFLTSHFLVQVSKTSIRAQSLTFELDDELKVITPGWEIDGVAHSGQALVFWNNKEHQLQFIDDIDHSERLSTVDLSENGMIDLGKGQLECQIVRRKSGQVIIYLAGNDKLVKFSPNLPSAEKLITLCSGHIKALTPLEHWLCFVRNGNEVVAIHHWDSSMINMNCDMKLSDIELRKVSDNSFLAFTTQEVAFFKVFNAGDLCHWTYELNLPYERNFDATILDAQIDERTSKVFLRHFDGLHVLEMSFFSWNHSKYILRSTRDTNKKFIFVEKINRMLVINFDSNKWDCIKLSNGKTLPLNSSVLCEQTASLIDVIELPCEGKAVSLILNFGKLIKLVLLLPQRGRIIVKQGHKMIFDHPILPFAAVRPDGSFYILRAERKPDPEMDTATILAIEVTQAHMEITKALTFSVKNVSDIKEFVLCGRDILINHNHHSLLMFRDICNSMSRNELIIGVLDFDFEFDLKKLYPLNVDCFVAAMNSGEPDARNSELVFFHRSGMGLSRDAHIMPGGEQPYSFFKRALEVHRAQRASQRQTNSSPETGDDDDSDVMEEMDEIDAFERIKLPSNKRPRREAHRTGPYNKIALPYFIRDITYDATAKKLFVLTDDNSVVVYLLDREKAPSW